MKLAKYILIILASFIVVVSIPIIIQKWIEKANSTKTVGEKSNQSIDLAQEPNDWFFAQRAFPRGEINLQVFREAQLQTQVMKLQKSPGQSLTWELAGPTNVGGRISDVEFHPANADIIYAGAASGGIFKSEDRGQTWTPVFDQAPSLSIGDISLDPANTSIIYAGTGEVNAGGGSQTYPGNGLYRSTNAGQTWEHLGLETTENIARVVVDPQNSQRIFVAAMGRLFANNPDRGLYRSTDGGASWEQVLFLSDSTGCIDAVIHPTNPDTIYAAFWERVRRPDRRSYGGITSGLYRSADGGNSWEELTGGLPNNSPAVGRIGLAISSSNPAVLYAVYVNSSGPMLGIYKTTNGGDNWTRTNDGDLSSDNVPYWWWFGNIRVDPANPDIAFVLGLNVWKTIDGGDNWFFSSGNMHVDHHGMSIHPQNSNVIVSGNDGGIYLSEDGGSSYIKSSNLPITQFYTCEVDFREPQRLYGGTQDNGTNRTLSGSLDDWQRIFGGDGFYVLVDPADNRFVYVEFQWGNLFRSVNGGNSFIAARSGILPGDRNNWNSPLAMDPGDPQTLYFGTNRVYRSTNRAASWSPISPDLSNGPSSGNLVFGTVTTIAVASSNSNVIYAGTDDGNLWVTQDGGNEWTNISASLPQRWITRVAIDPFDEQIAYVTISGYRWAEPLPHIFRTTNTGSSWEAISGNLPEVPLNDVIIDPETNTVLYIASDAGVFVTENLGSDWTVLGDGLPNVPVNDLVFHNPTRTLIAATYGRSMYKINLGAITSLAENENPQPRDFVLFQNYPNPFNPETTIRFSLKNASTISLEIFNSLGQKVRRLPAGSLAPGNHQVVWDGKDDLGNPLSSGHYIYRLKTETGIAVKRMVLAK